MPFRFAPAFSILTVGLVVASVLVTPVARAQSCSAADAALGAPKSKGKLKSSYDKFTDSTYLESKSQAWEFLGQNETMQVSFIATHAGQTASPMLGAIHLKGTHQVNGHVQVVQTPDLFSDSSSAIVLADTARFSLRASGHRAKRVQTPLLGPPSITEDVYFPITTEQLALLARAHAGGIRIGAFDLSMQRLIAESADAVYRAVVCESTQASTGAR
jgi:hypothetical protein